MNDLQEKLALAQLENMKLREALNAMRDAFDVGGDVTSEENNALHKADKALSNPTTHAELDAYVDAKFGEPVAIASQHYEYSGKGYGSVATDQLDITLTAYGAKTVRIGSKLYTAPPQPQTVKDALEEAARICDECGYGWAGVAAERIRALIEKE